MNILVVELRLEVAFGQHFISINRMQSDIYIYILFGVYKCIYIFHAEFMNAVGGAHLIFSRVYVTSKRNR